MSARRTSRLAAGVLLILAALALGFRSSWPGADDREDDAPSVAGPASRHETEPSRQPGDCSGPVRVLDERGAVLPATVELVTTDFSRPTQPQRVFAVAAPTAWAEGRPCSAAVTIHLPNEAVPVHLGDHQARHGVADTFVVDVARDVLVAVVDAGGHPVDASLSLPSLAQSTRPSLERVGVGRFRGTARTPFVSVKVAAAGFVPLETEVAADGREARVVLDSGRLVRIEATCDTEACPDPLYCDSNDVWTNSDPCLRHENRYLCRCASDGLPSELTTSGSPFILALVPPDVESAEVDLRFRPAGLYGTWTGGPGRGSIQRRDTRGDVGYMLILEASGAFYAGGVSPGVYDVELVGVLGTTTREVTVEAGETLDLGQVGPDAHLLDGLIVTDEPLGGASLLVGAGSAAVGEDGVFEAWVSSGQPTVRLRLVLRSGRRFSVTVDTDDSVVWLLDPSGEDTASARTDTR